jgi:N-acetylglucosamine-6-phosphate deacetylase
MVDAQRRTLRAARALVDGALVGPVDVVLQDDRIVEVVAGGDVPPGASTEQSAVSLDSGVLTPGLVDLQVNGSFGVDFATGDPQQWTDVLSALAGRGVTSVQPTVVTAPLDELHASCERAWDVQQATAGSRMARVLGVHLEGPFLSPARAGAHRAEWMRDPSPAALDALLGHEPTAAVLRTVTLAPERPFALDAVARLAQAGVVVSVGHTGATADQVWAAADAGATMTTHVFNAQRPLGHREPGVPGAVLTDPRFFVGTIVDGRHVHPRVVGLVLAAAPGRVVAVTDAIVTAGLPSHTPQTFGGDPVENDDMGLGRRPDGTIAGSGIVLDEGVRRMVAAGLDPAVVLSSATEVPARSLRRDDIGVLRAGGLADLVWWDEHYRPRRVWVGGVELAPQRYR